MERVQELGRGRLMLDLGFRDTEGLVAAYLFETRTGWALVETGPTTSRAALAAGLAAAGIAPGEVSHVFVTHIHLDHAGGLGAAAASLPAAHLYVHREGVPHMVDPTKLTASARRAWGAAADPLWGPILPVPAERLSALDGGESFPLKEGALQVLATPGHARHHLSYFDTSLGALLTGDSAGVRLDANTPARPAIPPPDLDLELLFGSLERMKALRPRSVLYTHFGPAAGTPTVFDEYRAAVERWRDAALEAAQRAPDVGSVAAALQRADGGAAGPGADVPARNRLPLVSSYELAAQGLLRYFRTHGLVAPERP